MNIDLAVPLSTLVYLPHIFFARALNKKIKFQQVGPDIYLQTFDENGVVPILSIDSYLEKFISELEEPGSYYQALDLLGLTGKLPSREVWKNIYAKSKFNDSFGFFEPCPTRKKLRVPRAYSRLARKILS